MLGTVDQDFLLAILESLQAGDAAALLQVAADMGVRSLSFSAALQELGALLTRLQIIQCVPSAVDDDEPEKERLVALARTFSPEFVQLAYQIVNIGRVELASAPDEYSGFVMTLLRLHTFRPSSVADVVGTVAPRRAAAVAASAPAVRPAPATVAVPSVVSASPTPYTDVPLSAPAAPAAGPAGDWHQIVAALSVSGLARELAQNCELRRLEEGLCLLRLSPKQGHLQMKPSPERLQQALAEYLGRPVQLRIEVGDIEVDTPAATAGRQRQELQERAASAIAQDGFVRDMIDTLDASVVDSSIKPIA